MTAETFLFVLSGGLVLGALYALMATGLAVVWTTLGIFNFAHGAFITLGAYVAWQVGHADAGDAGFLAGALAAVAALFLTGLVFHLVLVKPFERKPNVVLLSVITTLAGATILENLINIVWGPRSKQLSPMVSGEP